MLLDYQGATNLKIERGRRESGSLKRDNNKLFDRHVRRQRFDALLDALLLSQCDFLLRTESNLSKSCRFFNPTQENINLSTEFAYSTPDWTKPKTPNIKRILGKVASAYQRKQALSKEGVAGSDST